MKRVVGVFKPFAAKQRLLVYEDGNRIDAVEAPILEIADTLFNLAEKYEIDRVDLTGPKQFTKGLASQFQTLEKTKYNKNSLTYNII